MDFVAMDLDYHLEILDNYLLFVVVVLLVGVYLFEVFLDLDMLLEMVLYKLVVHVVVKHLNHRNVE
jgi:hypothetical protein